MKRRECGRDEKTPVALSLTGATTLCDLVARMSVAQSGEGVSLTPVLAASKSPVALSLTGATTLCDLVTRMSVAQSGDLLV
ncbi:hypothetical protein [Klebsiella aerogenes]|uniref:hypothetical protein n=1 Tax=Klebsiella aerogenes TaxID=548 RepID=UPI0018C8C4F9|nr:hypothetical protein [Klebsiella aerogenes]